MAKKPVIVTVGTPDRCVIFGHADGPVKPGDSPKLIKARMVLYWSKECGGLFGLAANGPKTNTRLTAPVTTWTGEVTRVIAVSAKVAKELDRWPIA